MSNNPLNDGPYPRVDRPDQLKQGSHDALNAITPRDRFITRIEPESDKGVDLSLEATIGGTAVNARAHVQLKGTDEDERNTDGSFSLSVKTSNLNYLLNGPCPLYIVWFASTNELKYAWARDEARRLHRDNPDWHDQQNVTIRFRSNLEGAAWNEIHDRIVREASMHRQTHDALTRAGIGEPVALEVTPDALEVMTPTRAQEIVRQCGIGLISAGYAQIVLRRADFLAAVDQADPQVQLTVGFAAFSLGDYFRARSHLGRAMPDRARLSPFSQFFLDSLIAHCDFRFGATDEDERDRTLANIEREAPEFLALQLRLDRVRREHLRESGREQSCALLAELHRLVDAIEAGAGDATKLQARLIRFNAESSSSGMAYLHCVLDMQIRTATRAPLTPAMMEEFQAVQAAEIAVERQGGDLLAQAIALGHPMLIADAIVARASQAIIRFIDLPVVAQALGRTPPPLSKTVVWKMQQELTRAVEIYQSVGNGEGHVRAALLLARWLEMTGSIAEASSIATQMLGIARGLGLTQDAEDAAELLAGRSERRQLEARLSQPPDPDAGMASMTDDQVRDFAHTIQRANHIQINNLPALERVAFAGREIARARMQWCRHLDVLELRHDDSTPDRWYVVDPQWRAICERRRHRSLVLSKDATAVMESFKGCYCIGCEDRSPKNQG